LLSAVSAVYQNRTALNNIIKLWKINGDKNGMPTSVKTKINKQT
jgi:hypothetical protein